MSSTAALEKAVSPASGSRKNGASKYVTTETYYEEYRDREDGWKYELVDGIVEKNERTMNDKQNFIATNLHKFFFTLLVQAKVNGTFQAEKDNELWKNHVRIPDMCYMSQQQVVDAYNGKHPVSEFVIEVVSPSDKADKYTDKIKDYFTAGVQVVWMIYPKARQVYVYVKGSSQITICEDDMICTAAPVLPEFALSVNDIFRAPVL